MAAEYLREPFGFAGFGATPSGDAMLEYQRIEDELKQAESELSANPEPTGVTRSEALADHDLWTQLCEFETARDAVRRLTGEFARARAKAEGLGHMFAPVQSPEISEHRGQVRIPNRSIRREMLNNL